MPTKIPKIVPVISELPTLVEQSSTHPVNISVENFVAILENSQFNISTFAASFQSLYFSTSGQSYVPHLDYINIPQFAPPLTIEEEDMIAGSTISPVDSTAEQVTLYLGLFEDVSDSAISLPVPSGTINSLQVRASNSPGTGKNFTYTIMKNGSVAPSDASPMQAIVSNTNQSGATSTNPVSCSAGDRISVRLVADSGANLAHHRFTIKYTITS